jgi:8-oxo-dGTP pyrophosphatase MutT (NUDIX family)
VTIRRLSSRVVYENAWLRLREDAIERPDGVRGVYALVEKEDFAVVVPWDGEALTLVGQFRYPVGRFTWEFPQGGVAGASPEETARTELREETGLRAGRLRHLGRLDNAVGMSSQGFDVFLATELEAGAAAPEPEEVGMRTRRVGRAAFEALVRDGAVTDSSSLSAWLLVRLAGGVGAA